jgi:ankyrin repeat protein
VVVNLVDTLLQYGAEPNGQPGKIPLFVACQNNNGSLARMLLSNGADPNIRLSDLTVPRQSIDCHENGNDESDETPLHGKRARMTSSDIRSPSKQPTATQVTR